MNFFKEYWDGTWLADLCYRGFLGIEEKEANFPDILTGRRIPREAALLRDFGSMRI